MVEKINLPSLTELSLHSVCTQIISANGFYDIKSKLNFLPPRLVKEVEWNYQIRIQPQISKWRRCHWQFFLDIQQYFSRGGGGEICENAERITDIVIGFKDFVWTPFLAIDYTRTANCLSERMPKTCSHLSKLSVPNCDPTTCRDGLEFDSETF